MAEPAQIERVITESLITFGADADQINRDAELEALDIDSLDLLQAAEKVPPELAELTRTPQARRFIERAREIASPDDWEALLDMLERRRAKREKGTPG